MKTLSSETKSLAGMYYRAIGTPLAAQLHGWLHTEEWDLIANCKVDPRAYTSAQEYYLDASAASLLRKCKDLPTDPAKRQAAALANWTAGEVDCFKTNERLSPYLEGLSHPDCNGDVHSFILKVREKIAHVLGRAPAMEHLRPNHGPGATFSDKSVRSTVADKMEVEPSMTTHATWFLLDWVGTAWGREALRRGVCPTIVRGNRFTTAPKDATKDRPIAVEPSINVFYQLALGLAVRSRLLKMAGIDLVNGQHTHRSAAMKASLDGLCATLDLKNASDTVAYILVKLLLPADWFLLFNELRSPFTGFSTGGGGGYRWHKLEKFSSMGNGYTFELETLIFWALVHTASAECAPGSERDVLVYGDDIICRADVSRPVIAVLRFFGMTLNLEKSFVEGPFRESCGGDFWDGRPVRPIYFKESLDEPQHFIAAANQIRRAAKGIFGSLDRLYPAWLAAIAFLPHQVRRCRGPEGLGDLVVHDEEGYWRWTSERRDRIFCYRPVRTRKVSLRCFSEGTVLACGLYGIPVSEGFVVPRDSVSGYAIRKVTPYGVDWVPSPVIRLYGPAETIAPRPREGPSYNGATRVVRARRSEQVLSA